MNRFACVMPLAVVVGCVAYEPQSYEDTNGDGHVSFHDDNPYASRGLGRHMARQSPDYREEDESND